MRPGNPSVVFFCHNEPERGSYFRFQEFARAMARSGAKVTLMVSARHARYRAHAQPDLFPPDDATLVQTPHWTLFHDRQEGWGLLDWAYRCFWVLRHRPQAAVIASHKPSCLIPGLLVRLLGGRLIYDWVDWWSGPQGIFARVVCLSEAFLSLPRPIQWWRRLGFAVESVLEWAAPRLAHQTIVVTADLYDHPAAPRSLSQQAPVVISGAPLETIRPRDKSTCRQWLSEKVLLPTEGILLGYMAGFHGAETLLLDALTLAVERGANLHLLVAGAPLSTLAPRHHAVLHHRIMHLGRLPFPEVDPFLGGCDALLLPLTTDDYDRGRYPHKLGDYLAAGRPTLLPDVGEAARRMKQAGLSDMISASGSTPYSELIRTWAERSDWWEDGGARCRIAAETFWNWAAIQRSFERIVLGTSVPEWAPPSDG